MNIFFNFLYSIKWLFFWMNISDFVLSLILNWIIFRRDSMNFQKRSPTPISKWIPQSGVFSNVIQNTPNQDAGYFDSHSFCIIFSFFLLTFLQTWTLCVDFFGLTYLNLSCYFDSCRHDCLRDMVPLQHYLCVSG